MDKRRWTHRSVLLTTFGGVLLAAVPVLVLLDRTSASDGPGVAGVLSLPFTVVEPVIAIVTIVWGVLSRPRDASYVSRQAQSLATAIATSEARALLQLLGDTGQPVPANLSYARTDSARVTWRADGGEVEGCLATIGSYYRQLTLGRLVVLGEAGAGKTVLALGLLLDLIDSASHDRVPVRLSLPAFKTSGTEAEDVRRALDRWICRHLVAVHHVHPAVAKALVSEGRVLPILDGLDEMDEQRAAQVVAALNLPVGPSPSPVVLTCRTSDYTGRVLQDATAITVLPVAVDQAIEWIERRLPDARDRRRWEPVLSTLRAYPDGQLAQRLSSPLRLYLALTVYQAPDTKPQELCSLPARGLDAHLLGQLVPTLAAAYPRSDGSLHSAAQVRTWLETLAAYGESGFHVSALWRASGRTVQYSAAAVLAVLLAILNSAGLLLARPATSPWELFLLAALTLVLFCTNLVAALSRSPQHPVRVDLRRIRSPKVLTDLRSGVRKAVKVGPMVGTAIVAIVVAVTVSIGSTTRSPLGLVVATLLVGSSFGLVIGVYAAVVVAITFNLEATHDSAATPGEPHRAAIRTVAAVSISFAALISAVGWLIGGPRLALVAVLVAGIPVGLSASGAARWWVHYQLFIRRQARTGCLPRDLPAFLDWAYHAGLLRLAGAQTQFRHAELQTYFASR